jgi:chromosome partitioning protein
MDILTIASAKGGSGKSTLAAHLAVEAECTGAGPVAVVATDPQGCLAAWWNTRTDPTPHQRPHPERACMGPA